MLILHISNLGCRRPRLHTEPVDLLAYTGDAECVDVIEWLLDSYSRIVYVTGEREVPAARRRLEEAGVLADGRILEVAGLGIAGVGGLGMKEDIEHLDGVTRVSILLSHFPPYMMLDRDRLGVHRGITKVSSLSARLGASAVLYGHSGMPGCIKANGVLYSNASNGWYSIIEWPSRGGPECLGARRLPP
ncbi:MAG: hypothetical protein GSR78_02960 [Desulfurococcales archaeon]|nr:hypothetical protein [Desulfurococcales archaeon]